MQTAAPSVQSKASCQFSGLIFCFYLSLPLLMAVHFLWLRSWTVRDTLPIKHAGQQWQIVSFRGRIAIDNELQQINDKLGIVAKKVRAERDYFNARRVFEAYINEPVPAIEKRVETKSYFERGRKVRGKFSKSMIAYHSALATSFPPTSAILRYSWSYYLLIIPLSIPGMLCLLGASRRMHRRYRGYCVLCGYDLRASPERCPECGCETA